MNVFKKALVFSCVALMGMQAHNAQAETIIVAADATWPPFEMLDEDKEVVGYAIDYIKAVAEAVGLEVEIRNTAWDGIFAALGSNQCDVIASSVTITEERQEVMAFTEPYFENYQALVVPEDSDITTFAELDGLAVGGQIGTTGMLFLPELSPGAEARTYDEVGLAMQDLQNGRIDAVVCDELVAYYYAEQNPDYADDMKIVTRSEMAEMYGFALRQEDTELLEMLNEGIAAIKASGQAEEIANTWLR